MNHDNYTKYYRYTNGLGSDGTALPYDPHPHAEITRQELEELSQSPGHQPARPLDFPTPHVQRGLRDTVLAFNPRTGERKVLRNVIFRAEFLPRSMPTPPTSPRAGPMASPGTPMRGMPPPPPGSGAEVSRAYYAVKKLQDAIYGSVEACVVLVRHEGDAADDAARAAGFEPGDPRAPIVWEITDNYMAVKKVEWRRVHAMRGRLLEDPVKEVAAMQWIGSEHPNVLGSIEVLQDDEYLFSVMPYFRDGDLFGVVLAVAEERQLNEAVEGSGGMTEPVARYWFRQILNGLHHLQSKGICHRDLSLENILVDVNHCAVIDMGMCLRVPYFNPQNPSIATDVTHGTVRRLLKPQGTCGKMNYMSPEIYANKDIFDGFAVDLWAAGVILYIMLTGFPPYDIPAREDERFDIICSGDLVRQLHAWEVYVSEEAGHLLQWMLTPEHEARPTLAQVMRHEWVVNGEVQPPHPINY